MFLLLLSIGISMEMKVASCIDISFIRMYINYSKKPNPDLKSILLTHPALKAIMRHQNLNGVVNVNIEDTFKMMTKNKPDIDYLIKALHKIEKNSELCDLWKISAKILPKNFKFVGRIYFVFGYDIGAASPPDIIINLGHTKFIEHPNEIEPYIIHEIHHIGFLAYQKMPSLTQLEIKENLLKLIKWATQSEGMAVHAAYTYRKKHKLLKQDHDYKVYFDEQAKKASVKQYSELLKKITTSRGKISNIDTILCKMSSKERLWYKLGALISKKIVDEQGDAKLIESILNPQMFWTEAEMLLKGNSSVL